MVGGLISALMTFGLAVPAIASSPSQTELIGNNWRIFNVMPATSSFWDINQAKSVDSGGIEFPFQAYAATTSPTASFATYLQTNYNTDLTGKTITADVSWTAGTYVTRNGDPANVRIEFQDVASGKYTSNDYWWYSGHLDLSTTTTGILTASLSDSSRANWTNVCGKPATDMTPNPSSNCVGGTDPAVSPYDGFTNAMKNVKSVSLSFGGEFFASGAAIDSTSSTATFNMSSFTIN